MPLVRELSNDDYIWLGRTVWEQMQTGFPSESRRGLSKKEIAALIEEMRRNRDEFRLQLGDLARILSSRVKEAKTKKASEECVGEEPVAPARQGFGFDLGRIVPAWR